MGEQYIYLIRTFQEDGTTFRIDAFLDKDLAGEYFENDLKYYRKQDWSVDDRKNECGSGALRTAFMTRKSYDSYEHRTIVLERHDIIKK